MAPCPVVGTHQVAARSKRRPAVTAPPLTALSALERLHTITNHRLPAPIRPLEAAEEREQPRVPQSRYAAKRPFQPPKESLEKSMMMPQGQWLSASTHSPHLLGPINYSRKQNHFRAPEKLQVFLNLWRGDIPSGAE